MKHVVQLSGGLSSWLAARRVQAKLQPGDEYVLLFADTLIEDEDLYRFLGDVERDVGVPITRIADGRTPWQVFKDKRFLGNSRVDPCSKILKRDLLRRWMEEHCEPASTICYTGLGWWEEHRHVELVRRNTVWRYESPLCERPYVTHPEMEELAEAAGIRVPRLYRLGFKHNNCGGGCVKAGIGQFAHLYKVMPERFAEWERNENELRAFLGKDVAMLEDRRGGVRRPLPLTKLRARLEGREEPLDACEINDVRGCGCATDADPDEDAVLADPLDGVQQRLAEAGLGEGSHEPARLIEHPFGSDGPRQDLAGAGDVGDGDGPDLLASDQGREGDLLQESQGVGGRPF